MGTGDESRSGRNPGARDGPRAAGEKRRRAMLEAARRLFLEKGFDGVSVDDIIAAAGGSKATLYGYFGDKQGLFAALINDVARDILEGITVDVTASDPRIALTRLGTAYCTRVLSDPVLSLYRLAVAEVRRFPEIAAAFWSAGPKQTRAALAAYLATATRAGRLTVADPESAANLFFAMLLERHLAIALGVSDPPTPRQIDGIVATAVEIFLRSFGPRRSARAKFGGRRRATGTP